MLKTLHVVTELKEQGIANVLNDVLRNVCRALPKRHSARVDFFAVIEGAADQGQTHIACHLMGCRLIRETRDEDAQDGVAGNVRQAVPVTAATVLALLTTATPSADSQGLTLVPISAQLELFCPPYNPA
jgi:hypothetical protein